MKVVLLSLVSILVIGCATTGQDMPVITMENLAPGNALISVNRASSILGAGRTIRVTDNKKVVGKVSSGRSIVWQRPAGEMNIQLVPSFGMVKEQPPIKFNVKAGKKYYYRIYLGSSGFEIIRKP